MVEEDVVLMTSSLTQIVPLHTKKTPFLMEVPLPKGLDGPFLVSSSKDFLWVADRLSNDTIRAAVRKSSLPDMFRSLVQRALENALLEGWGSCHPSTSEGLREAAGHLMEYGMGDMEILYAQDFDIQTLDILSLPASEASWLPSGWAVVVPSNRGYLGTAFDFGGGNHAAVLHNASRAIGFLVPKEVLLAGVVDESAGEFSSVDP